MKALTKEQRKVSARKRVRHTAELSSDKVTYTTTTDKAIEAQRVEAERRLQMIMNGKHPDSGKPLTPSVEAGLRPGEQVAAQMFAHFKTGAAPRTNVRALIEAYGAALADEPRFLTEITIQLPWNDFFERIRPTSDALGGFGPYDIAVIELMREFGHRQLQEMAQHMDGQGAVYGWMGLRFAHTFCLPVPGRIMNYLADAAAKIIDGSQPEEEGLRKVQKEPERVGEILGFGGSGRGRRSMVTVYSRFIRDCEIYDRVCHKVSGGEKLDEAYYQVADEMKKKRSMVVRGYLRVRKLEEKRRAKKTTAV